VPVAIHRRRVDGCIFRSPRLLTPAVFPLCAGGSSAHNPLWLGSQILITNRLETQSTSYLLEDGTMSKQHPRDFRERAVPLVTESHGDHDTEWSSIREVAMRFCVGPEKVRKCFRQAEI
jgi:hypothetical protein